MTDTTTLIVTANDDTTADLVADALASRGGKALLIDVGDFPINLSVTGTIGHDGVWRGEFVAAGNTVLDLESIGAVYQHVELPAGVTAGIHRYLATAGLTFGAFDFVMDQAGELWWMECNPNGE